MTTALFEIGSPNRQTNIQYRLIGSKSLERGQKPFLLLVVMSLEPLLHNNGRGFIKLNKIGNLLLFSAGLNLIDTATQSTSINL